MCENSFAHTTPPSQGAVDVHVVIPCQHYLLATLIMTSLSSPHAAYRYPFGSHIPIAIMSRVDRNRHLSSPQWSLQMFPV